jgi:hypothetical protein
LEEGQEVLGHEVRQLGALRKYNIGPLIFGLEEQRSEGYSETLEVVTVFFRNVIKLDILRLNIAYVSRFGTSGRRSILARFTFRGKKNIKIMKTQKNSRI